MSAGFQNGKNLPASASLSNTKSRFGCVASCPVGRKISSSASTCTMTASSRPMVAASAGETEIGRSE